MAESHGEFELQLSYNKYVTCPPKLYEFISLDIVPILTVFKNLFISQLWRKAARKSGSGLGTRLCIQLEPSYS